MRKETIWITKYALTTGIQKIENAKIDGDMASWQSGGPGKLICFAHGKGREWHLSFALAVKRAQDTQLAKIHSLERQIERLENLDFRKQRDA